MTKLKKNGEKGNWFSFKCLTVKSVWITFYSKLFVIWFACLQLEITWSTFIYLLLKTWLFFLSYVLWSRQVTRVTTDEAPQRTAPPCLEQTVGWRAGKQTGLFWKIIMTRSWHNELATKKPNWISKSSLLALTLKPKLIYLHMLLNV